MINDPSIADDEALARELYEQELLEEKMRRKIQEKSDAAIARQLAEAEASEQQQQQQYRDQSSILLADELLAKELMAAEEYAAMAQLLATANEKSAASGSKLLHDELLVGDSKAQSKELQRQPKPLKVSGRYQDILGSSTTVTDEQRRMLTQMQIDETYTDLHEMFMLFNQIYFNNQLDSVEVRWSNRMTRCAGTCTFRNNGHCTVALSEPLLKFRTRKNLIETLLHEMIHALLFITSRNTDRDGHGPPFLAEADRINRIAGLNISVYHDFHDEVEHYQVHVWKCNGVCQDRPPYFGIVRRAMNRPPQKADTWFAEHQATCGGTFTKISEPELITAKSRKRRQPSAQTNKLTNYLVIDDDVAEVKGKKKLKQ